MRFNIIGVLLFSTLTLQAQEKNTFTLEEAITLARENSYAMLDAQDDIEAAKRKVWETTTMGLPQINGTVDYQNFLKQPVQLIPAEFFGGEAGEFAEISFGTKHNMSASATLTQLLFDGSYLVGLQSARVYLKISESIKTKTDISVKEGVINAYAGVLMTQEGIEILKKNKASLEKNLFETREIIKNGFAEEQDAEQLALTLNGLENQLKNMQRMEQYNLNMLKYVMGIPIENEITLTQNLENLLTTYQDLTILSNPFQYTEHIDYLMAENSVKAGELLTKLEQSKALPSLSAFVNYGVNAYNDRFKLFNSEQKWFGSSVFGIQMNVPIFSSLQRTSRVQQAKINLDKALRNQDVTEEKLVLAYQTAKLDYENALESYQTAKEGLRLAESIEKKESIKFFEGISGSFELSNAQNQLYGKQQEYLQSIFNLISKKAALENALGR
jgi:outer membrane protein TolC